jgi:hypothetical protein
MEGGGEVRPHHSRDDHAVGFLAPGSYVLSSSPLKKAQAAAWTKSSASVASEGGSSFLGDSAGTTGADEPKKLRIGGGGSARTGYRVGRQVRV